MPSKKFHAISGMESTLHSVMNFGPKMDNEKFAVVVVKSSIHNNIEAMAVFYFQNQKICNTLVRS